MRRNALFATFGTLALATAVNGQEAKHERTAPLSPSEKLSAAVTPTPEMWLYLKQLETYDNPSTMVRVRAEQKTAARDARLESRRWFGYSNLRPQANPIPTMSLYSEHWRGNGPLRYQWVGGTYPYPISWR